MLQTSHVRELDDRTRVNLLIDREGDVFTGVFIDNVADLDCLAVPGRIKLEIQCPHIIRVLA
ncbi:hypothetical protein V3M57_09845 [Trueperella pyogenes]